MTAPFNEFAQAYVKQTSGVDIVTSTTTLLITVPPGYVFLVYQYVVSTSTAEATFVFKSGTTAISRTIKLLLNTHQDRANSGMPILVGRVSGEDLNVTTGGTSTDMGVDIIWALREIAV